MPCDEGRLCVPTRCRWCSAHWRREPAARRARALRVGGTDLLTLDVHASVVARLDDADPPTKLPVDAGVDVGVPQESAGGG
jgi:hypothetical protein